MLLLKSNVVNVPFLMSVVRTALKQIDAVAKIFISYLLILDQDLQHPKNLAAADGRLNPCRNLKTFISLMDSAYQYWESIIAGADTIPFVKVISPSLAQLHSILPVLAALHVETVLLYRGRMKQKQQMVIGDC